MVSWLERQGLKSMHKKTLRTIWAAAAHIEGHITRELEKYMATLNESVTALVEAVSTELAQVRAEAQAAVDAAKAALEAAGSENSALAAALQEQISQNEHLVQTIDDAQARIDALTSQLGENDPRPDNELPGPGSAGGEHPDNTLPGPGSEGGAHPDNTLPGPGSAGGEHPDNTLPNELPGASEGEPYPDPRGKGRGGRK